MAGWASISHYTVSAVAGGGTPHTTHDIVTDTNRRDVSEMLDLLALTDTPFINRVGWGPESGGTKIEWISEDLGPGYLVAAAAAGSGGSGITVNTIDGMSVSEAVKQVYEGSVLYHYSSTDGQHAMLAVLTAKTGGSVDFEFVTNAAFSSYETSITAADKMWVLGALVGEASAPRKGRPRNRVVNTNTFAILRQDVQISGSEAATDFYAINREDRHQILLRMKEMQRDRERIALYSLGQGATASSTIPNMCTGVFGMLSGQSGTHIDTSTTSLLETSLNTVVNHLWDNGAGNLGFFGNINQCAKFTQWDKNRIRMAPRDTRGGGHVKYFMTESGIELEIVPMRQVPTNIAFILDTSKIKLRAKRGRKAILEKLGKRSDADEWQMISEFSLEMKGYNLQQHGMFTKLS